MSHLQTGSEPAPVLPLAYYGAVGSPWAPAVRFLSWVALSYALIVIGNELTYVAIYIWQESVGGIYRFTVTKYLTSGIVPCIPAVVLVVGSILSLRQRRPGRGIILWTSVFIGISWIAVFLYNVIGYIFDKTGGLRRSDRISLIVVQVVYGFQWLVYRSFVPTILACAFRRREVRDVFERA